MCASTRPAFYRLRDIIGDRRSTPSQPGLIPVSRTTWWEGVRSGRFPKPVKIGRRITAWRAEDIHKLIERLSEQADDEDASRKQQSAA